MSYSVQINWYTQLREHPDRWVNLGQSVLREQLEDEDTRAEWLEYFGYDEEPEYPEEIAYEHCEPMMNYGYPLETEPAKQDVLKVIKRTNCTVMYDQDTEQYYIVLTGGGMNLSQDIALAYHILETWIPYELCVNVSLQKGLSVGGDDWDVLVQAMKKSLMLYEGRAHEYLRRWEKHG